MQSVENHVKAANSNDFNQIERKKRKVSAHGSTHIVPSKKLKKSVGIDRHEIIV